MARTDAEGRIWIVGRAKDMILRGGQNIFPLEIEELLGTHPNIVNVLLFPCRIQGLGKKPVFILSLRRGRCSPLRI